MIKIINNKIQGIVRFNLLLINLFGLQIFFGIIIIVLYIFINIYLFY